MGSVASTPDGTDDPWWPIENQNFSLDQSPLLNVVTMDRQGQSAAAIDQTDENCEISENVNNESQSEKIAESDVKNKIQSVERKEQTLEEFKEELRMKREKRQNAIADLRNEITSLRQQLADEKEENRKMKEERIFDDIAAAINVNDEPEPEQDQNRSNIRLKRELANVQLSLQLANSEILSLQAELNVRQKQTDTLKEVNIVSKQMIQIREDQLNQLREKLKTIEESLADRELSLMSENLRQEYDRQLTNIRNLRALYEERARVSAAERENLNRQLDTKKAELEAETEKTTNLTERVTTLEADLQLTVDQLNSTKDELSQYKSENRGLHEEMKVINQLFSQLLMGFNGGNDINIDKLSNMLEDNRDLLNDITNREICKDGAAALPKLLFDLVTQAEENDQIKDDATSSYVSTADEFATDDDENVKGKSNVTTAQEICHNLPKVWKVLIELLNHQKAEQVTFAENGESEDCYNSVQTPTGPKLVLSVSKTYIKLKDLILEKKFLQKETNKLKNLNNHLEQRLNHQEKRLGAVSIELNKTWSLVGKMQRQHRQLHTHEQVLRYQLQQKRRMLNELKEELEYCRRKWALAREKNNESQSQWNDLRSEFSRRKLEDATNSGESGYSDEPVSDDENSDDESVKVKSAPGIRATELLATTSKKLLRVHSVSPTRNETTRKRDSSAPPISTFLTEVFQTTSEIVPTSLTLQASVVSKPVENLDLKYAAKSSVVEPKTAAKITVKNVATEGPSSCVSGVKASSSASGVKPSPSTGGVKPSPSTGGVKPSPSTGGVKPSPSTGGVKPSPSPGGVRPKCVDEIRPRLSRELRKKAVKVKEKKKGEETLEEMFFRLSGQEPPPPEPSENEEDDDDFEDIEVEKFEEIISPECAVSELNIQCESIDVSGDIIEDVTDELPNVEDISNIILSEDDEERRVRRAARFQRLEEQCQQLITQVINNSTRGDELNQQLDNVQRRYTPLRESSKSVEKSDEDGATGCSSETAFKEDSECLTQREQEYTSRRAERLKRLEEECKEFLNKQNKSKIRANEINNKLDKLHQRYGSQEGPEASTSTNCENSGVALRDEEEEYVSRRAERLKRLEEQSAVLLERMEQSASRASNIESNLDALHEKFGAKGSTEICTEAQLEEEYSLEVETLNIEDEDSLPTSDIHNASHEILEHEQSGDVSIDEETTTNTQTDTNNSN